MKLIRGDWSTIIVYNLILLMVVIGTESTELLYLLLGNILLIIIQISIKYKKTNDNYNANKDYKQIFVTQEDQGKIRHQAYDRMYAQLTSEEKRIWLVKQYIIYCVLIRKIFLFTNNENDLEDLKTLTSNYSNSLFLLNESKIEYLLKLEKKAYENDLRYFRENYYKKRLKEVVKELERDDIFKYNYNFFYNLEAETDNEIGMYVRTGSFGNFSNEFQSKMNNLFQMDINFVKYYYDALEYIYDELWFELYNKYDIKNI